MGVNDMQRVSQLMGAYRGAKEDTSWVQNDEGGGGGSEAYHAPRQPKF